MKPETIAQTTMFEDTRLITGTEEFPIIGSMKQTEAQAIILRFKGLKYYWDCLSKAEIVKDTVPGHLVLGSLDVIDTSMEYTYGFDFKLPYMFHAWIQDGEKILDFSLPGVIAKGNEIMNLNRTPSILVGATPNWCVYTPKVVMIKGQTIPYKMRNANVIVI